MQLLRCSECFSTLLYCILWLLEHFYDIAKLFLVYLPPNNLGLITYWYTHGFIHECSTERCLG